MTAKSTKTTMSKSTRAPTSERQIQPLGDRVLEPERRAACVEPLHGRQRVHGVLPSVKFVTCRGEMGGSGGARLIGIAIPRLAWVRVDQHMPTGDLLVGTKDTGARLALQEVT